MYIPCPEKAVVLGAKTHTLTFLRCMSARFRHSGTGCLCNKGQQAVKYFMGGAVFIYKARPASPASAKGHGGEKTMY